MSCDPAAPPPATLRWLLTRAGADELVAVEPLRGGWTSAMHAVVVRDGGRERSRVLRRMVREPWRTHAVGLLGREAAVMRLLGAPAIPAGAWTRRARRAGGLHRRAGAAHDPCARPAASPGQRSAEPTRCARSHARDDPSRRPPERDRPRSYQSWTVPERRVVPVWARDPRVWHEAFLRIDADPPPYRGCFLTATSIPATSCSTAPR
jgi:hypothetical protein